MTRSPTATSDQVAAFRLARHHLTGGERAALDAICSDVCGVQAQVMSAAEIALWTRRRGLTRDDIQTALWKKRTLVKMSLMRTTMHLVPAREVSLYVTALKKSRTAWLLGIFARRRVTPAQVARLSNLIVDALAAGPLSQREVIARIRPKADPALKFWFEFAWVVVRPAVVEGRVCYGPPRGAEVTLVRAEDWLPRQRQYDEDEAKQELLRRFLGAYGPATARDFSKWSGVSAVEARQAWEAIAGELQDVSVDGESVSILRCDLDALKKSRLEKTAVRLLPAFDPLLLAHASKDHLVDPRYYKRVYRNQGWLSPVVLAGGR